MCLAIRIRKKCLNTDASFFLNAAYPTLIYYTITTYRHKNIDVNNMIMLLCQFIDLKS